MRARRAWLIVAVAAVLSGGAAPAAARATLQEGADASVPARPALARVAGPVHASTSPTPLTAAAPPRTAAPDPATGDGGQQSPRSRAHLREPTAAELAAFGFEPGTGACAGAFNDFPSGPSARAGRGVAPTDASTCTHGPDILEVDPVAPGPSTAGFNVFGSSANPGYAPPESIPCYSTGPFVHVFYGYPQGGTNRLSTLRTKILQSVSIADDIYARSAAQAGQVRHVRWKTAGCQLVITAAALPLSVINQGYPGPVRQALESQGLMSTSEKGLIFTDEGGCGFAFSGIAEVAGSSISASTNPNNKGNLLARVVGCTWTPAVNLPFAAEVAAHEVTHTMGAVQNDAPNASFRTGGDFHCTDGDDVMCYDDGGGPPRAICPVAYPQYLDCRKDDYFSPAPASGSYIATHWNTASNQFLATAAPPSVQALPHPSASLTAPAGSGQVSGILDLAASATAAGDGSPVIQVEFWANGELVDIDGTAPYTAQLETRFDPTTPSGFPNGTSLRIVALAVDDQGRVYPSPIRTLDVENPTVHFTAPTPYATISGASVNWAAAATSGSAFPISKVEILDGGTLVATDTAAPYTGTAPLDLGANHLVARVTDSRGTTRDSGTRIVTRVDPAPTATMIWPSSSGPTVAPNVSQMLTATGTVAAGRTVKSVQFLVDGTPLVGTPTKVGTTWQLAWTPTTLSFPVVTFRLTDSSDAVATSAGAGLSVLDPIDPHPSLALTSPANGGTVTGSTAITAALTLPDAGWVIDGLDFYVNDILVGSDTNPSGGFTVPFANAGTAGPAVFRAELTAHDGTSTQFDTIDSAVVAGVASPTTFTLSTPANGAALRGDVSVTASISHPEYLQADPELWLGGDPVDILPGPTYTSTISSTFYENGTTTLQAMGSLLDGSALASPKVTVSFANAGISQTVPSAGATVTSRINLAATAAGTNEVGVEQVRFQIDGTIVGRDSYAPYVVAWDPAGVATGMHTAVAEMLMTDGSVVATSARSFTVARTPTVTRLAGSDRYGTAVAISKASFGTGVPAVYIATGASFPDALAGAAVAGHVGGPVLLVPGTSIPAAVATELTRLKPARIVVLGGTSVVSDGVKAALAAYTAGSVTRLAGSDRYGTAVAISKASFGTGVPAVYIATGASFPDALAGAAVAGHVGGPVLLVPGTSIPAAVATELTRLKPARIVVLGGTSVVSDGVKAALAAFLPA